MFVFFIFVAACGGDSGGGDTTAVSDSSPLFPDSSTAVDTTPSTCPEAEAAMEADPCVTCVCADDGTPTCDPVAIGTECATDDCCLQEGSCQPCEGEDCLESGLTCTGTSATTCGDEPVPCLEVSPECLDNECVCSETVSEDGTECVADANACTLGDSCEGGVCIQGEAVSLDDGNPCTSGLCVKGEVQQQLVTGQCSDGNLCTIGDECKLGQCVADELKECPLTACANTAFCDPDTGACNWEFKADGEACEMEGACEGVGACLDGECVSHTGVESCDGLDNDCDGETDEGLSQACQSACGAGVEVCSGGSWVDCNAPAPQAETCDGLDNDCNGQTDEGLGVKSCGLPGCETTVQACVNGVEQECVPTGGEPETCDGFDNDCDGWADEDGCYPAGTCDINIDVVCTPEKAHPAEYRVIGLNVPQGILSYNLVPGELLVNWCLNDTGINHFPLSEPSGCIHATWEIGLCLVPDGWVPTTCEKTECYSCP